MKYLRWVFWGLVIAGDTIALIVLLLLFFNNYSVLYWFMDAIDSVLQGWGQ